MEELREMVNNNNTNLFLNKLSHYVTNIAGSDAYWYKAKEDLKAIIQHAGPPTFFFTFSAADMHCPELHFLFGNNTNLFLNKLSHYVTNITGSDAYWYKAKEDLKAIIQHAGPHIFSSRYALSRIAFSFWK